MTRPFKVLGIQQIAIGGPDKRRLQKLWVDMLGLEVTAPSKANARTSTRTSVRWASAHSRSRST